MRVVRALSWLLAGIMIVAGAHWLFLWREVSVVKILAPRQVQLGLPVYAQFVVTQTVQVEPVELTTLMVPIYMPSAGQLDVSLWQNEQIIERWEYATASDVIVDATFLLSRPTRLAGQLSIQVDGSAFSSADKEAAPRVLVEPADYAYPHGSYRIAHNEKRGDIALELKGRVRNGQTILSQLHENPLALLPIIGRWLLVFLLIVALPQVAHLRRVVYSQDT